MAVSLCAGSLNALALHGFLPGRPACPLTTRSCSSGAATPPCGVTCWKGCARPISTRGTPAHGELNGNAPCNIVNRTLGAQQTLGMGAQLELSTPLREAMFTEHNRPRRKHTTTQLFWTFVAVCATRSTGSKPSRSMPGPGFDA